MRLLAAVAPGRHTVAWNGRGDDAHPLSSGVYVVKLKTDAGETARTVVLLR